jgi:hypothetical protein
VRVFSSVVAPVPGLAANQRAVILSGMAASLSFVPLLRDGRHAVEGSLCFVPDVEWQMNFHTGILTAESQDLPGKKA